MRAEKTHYPAGARACLSLDTVTGINLGNSGSSAVWAPRTDLTAPTAHPFVFYAGPAQNVPDLAVDLARRGLLRRHDITMTIDVVSDEIGPQARSEGGAYYHPDTVHHTFRQAPEVTTQVGVSGFRVDLGVIDPDLSSTFLAGIECDGATYHRSATARDRDRLRQAVLENLGWNILRIWSTDWWTNARREVERIYAALQSFLEIARQKRTDQAERDAAKAEALLNATRNEQAEDPVVSTDTPEFETVTDQPVSEPSPEEISYLEPLYAKAPEHIPSDDTISSDIEADPSRFTQDDYLPTLARLVVRTIDQARVIREDVLIQTMSRAHGFSRVGREIRERVQRAIPSSMARTEEDVGTFLWSDRLPVVPRLSLTSLTAEKSLDPALVPLAALVDL